MMKDLGHVSDPQAPLLEPSNKLVSYTFDAEEGFSPNVETKRLCVVWLNTDTTRKISVSEVESLPSLEISNPERYFDELITRLSLPALNLSMPWPLETLSIPKPWGAEIWYTGIEPRGICQAAGIPLPRLLNLLPISDVGSAQNSAPLLLKILDPLPGPLGDLYFELHEEKIEVYIVTSIDQNTWPGGVGKIRYGFDQEKRKQYSDDEAFKAAYLSAVDQYRQVRQTIDNALDSHNVADASPAQIDDWINDMSPELIQSELDLKRHMDSFTYLRDIEVGDVITVLPFFPHSLQHGVRVIEFQTASYERHILSFNQKVLTQNHWDTETALTLATLDTPKPETLETLVNNEDVLVEVVANFEAFTAYRISLKQGATHELSTQDDYGLAIGVNGHMVFDIDGSTTQLTSEQGTFLPANKTFRIAAESDSILLLAKPK